MKRIATLLSAIAVCVIAAAQKQNATPTMGWSSWNTYHVNISDSLIMKQADALVSLGLRDFGYNYVNIDDGFFGYRNADGTMQPHPKRFPNGLSHVVRHIHSYDMKAGIYSDAGANTCGSMYDNDANGIGAGLYGHEEQDAHLYFNEWGFDFIKIDYCGAGTELDLDEQQRYTEICHAIDRTAHKPIEINICRWAFPGTWAASVAKSWRISSDIRPRWSSIKHIIAKNLYLSAYCRDGHFNDMDMLEVGRGLSPDEENTHFAMWCVMSSPLLIGCDLTTLSEESLRLLKNKELIAINQDKLAQQARVAQHIDGVYVLVKDLTQRRSNTRAVAFYNSTDEERELNVPLSTLEMTGKVRLRDAIAQCDWKSVKENISLTLAPHATKVLTMQGKRTTEPTVYEAEWAYMPLYNDLALRKKPASYVHHDAASGGMLIDHVGGSKENTARWEDVYSAQGGHYLLTIHYLPGKHRKLTVWVNGTPHETENLKEAGPITTTTIHVSLNAGWNTIEMGSHYTWTPAIDKFELHAQ